MSVRTDVCSATFTARAAAVASIIDRLEKDGAKAKQINLHGRFHYFLHDHVVRELIDICTSVPMLRFPQHCYPLVPLRRNDSGNVVDSTVPLHVMALQCILVEKADWYTTLTNSLEALTRTGAGPLGEIEATALVLGPSDCTPRSVLGRTPIKVLRVSAEFVLQYQYPGHAIAVIGASCRLPGSKTPQQLWNIIRNKGTASGVPDSDSFDCAFFQKTPREAAHMDPQQRLALHLAYEALESGGYFGPSSEKKDDVGCYIGISSCDHEENVNTHPPTAFSFTGTARAFASGRISHFFGFTGPSMVVDAACSSSAVAIHMACKAIQSEECSMALAGGINLMTASARSHSNLGAAGFLSPSSQCKPFDAEADGYCRGEGGGFVLLKRLSAAVAHKNNILGVLAATTSNTAKGNRSITLPSCQSQVDLYQSALRMARMEPSLVSYVEAHGTGTQKGDPIECQSIRRVLGQKSTGPRTVPLRLGSVKSNIGHCEAASGLAALIKVLMMLQHNTLPPQANFTALNPAIPPLHSDKMEILLTPKPWDCSFLAALVNNYGASGSNVAMIVCQPPPLHPETRFQKEMGLFPVLLTAHSSMGLCKFARSISNFIEAQPWNDEDGMLPLITASLAQLQYSHFRHRRVFAVSSMRELRTELRSQVETRNVQQRRTDNSSNPTILVFAGQTGRRPSLTHEAYLGSIILRGHLNRCDRLLQVMGYRSLFPRIFNSELIDDLIDLHCMLFALQYSIALSWIDAGLNIKGLIGHSFGQLTALCVSGVLTLHDALTLISGRASLMQRKWGRERGSMLSVEADLTTVQAIIQSSPDDKKVEIACYNSLSHHVVAGTEASIAFFESAVRTRLIPVRRLSVSHGFHSPMVDCIMDDYRRLVQNITLHSATIQIEACSNLDGSWATITPELIYKQSREPVYFVDAVMRIEQRHGPCNWVEAGTGSTGVNMVRRVLGDSSHSFFSVQVHEPDAVKSLADTTIALWSAGVRVQYWPYHPAEGSCFPTFKLPRYEFDTAQYRLSEPERHDNSDFHLIEQKPKRKEAPTLVSLAGNLNDSRGRAVEFLINQNSDEYSKFVRGRKVLGQFMTPGSVFIESAARAFRLLPTHASSTGPASNEVQVRQVELHAPFGLNLQKHLRLILREREGSAWGFRVESYIPGLEDKSCKLQATGVLTWQREPKPYLGLSKPLFHHLYDWCEALLLDQTAEVVRGTFVKRLLSQMAIYEDDYFGIQSITTRGHEAVGDITTPLIASRSCVGAMLAPPLFDSFLLIAELHASSFGNVAGDYAYICNGIGSVLSYTDIGDLTLGSDNRWKVFSSLHSENETTIVVDIAVYNACRKTLVQVILGVRLKKIHTRSLRVSLEAINSSGETKRVESTADCQNRGTSEPGLCQHGSYSSQTDLPCMRSESSSCDGSATGLATPSETSSGGFDTPGGDQHIVTVHKLLANYLNCTQDIFPDTKLGLLGLDSLVAIQLQSDVGALPGNVPGSIRIDEDTTFSDLCGMVPRNDMSERRRSYPLQSPAHDSVQASVRHDKLLTNSSPNSILEVFACIKRQAGPLSLRTGLAGFYDNVYQRQLLLVQAYILEAFALLGCDLKGLKAGDVLSPVRHMPKYQMLVARFLKVLRSAGLFDNSDERLPFYRSKTPLAQDKSSAELYEEILSDFPQYRPDHQLLNLTGSRLADCLSGAIDPLKLIFGDEGSVALLENVYKHSPLFNMGNELLVEFISRFLSKQQRNGATTKIRILEIGAGTGATTQRVIKQLTSNHVSFIYVFTDVSTALVSSAKRKFQKYCYSQGPFDLEFAVLDIESTPPVAMEHSFDLIISSNCIHATRSLQRSCANIEKMLRVEGGMLCLVELTRPLVWLDCVFGLLDGWWRFNDGRTYALAVEDEWKVSLLDAGFTHVDWSGHTTQESLQIQLIGAWR